MPGIGVTSMFILLLVNKSTRDLWMFVKDDSSISDIVEMMKMYDILIHGGFISTNKMTQEMTQIFCFYFPVVTSAC